MLKSQWHIDRIEDDAERGRSAESLKQMLRFADTFACPGVGMQKLSTWGAVFLDAIREFERAATRES